VQVDGRLESACATRRERHGVLRFAHWPLLVVITILTGCALAPATSQERLARVEILALLQSLNADLLSHDSATLTLERWCADHRLAKPARIVARRVHDAAKPIPDALRARLAVDSAEPIAYRHVQLICGTHVLSAADNWYVPNRLTAEMNQRLDTTDEPFGKVVQALGFQRRTLSAQLLWSPLPAGWELAASNADREQLRIPQAVLRHEAILYTSAQMPFSAVVETYTNQLLDFGTLAAYLVAEAPDSARRRRPE
jgi:chorismate-pyruvate lyase